jgi:two-component system response regulator YesN
MPRHDLIGLELAIFLKSNLLRTLAATAPDEWSNHVAKFIARLEASNLQDATALAVLLADLRTQIGIVANAIGDRATEAAIDEPAMTSMSHDEVLTWFRAEMLAIISRAPRRVGVRSSLVEDVVQFIHRHYAESVTIGGIASALGQSRRQVVTAFRREMEQTINEYLTHVRMRHAVELIRQGCKIEVVSLMVGYRSRKNFYRHFKAVVGMTPRTYLLAVPREP